MGARRRRPLPGRLEGEGGPLRACNVLAAHLSSSPPCFVPPPLQVSVVPILFEEDEVEAVIAAAAPVAA